MPNKLTKTKLPKKREIKDNRTCVKYFLNFDIYIYILGSEKVFFLNKEVNTFIQKGCNKLSDRKDY